ncbi:hypothetical protein PG999_008466 [Apiospora kogelbergensis]|uniref:Uncharacterized protein n=1 Tax=Apiospora kogelbergensis TaxID=1337665 RepID=A0AAW0QGF2_9PEZI
MAVSLFILAAAILGLYIASTRNQGLGSASPNDSIVYLWRYLPTTGQFDSTSTLQFILTQFFAIVIVVLLAVWNGIDFSTRLLQPWVNLQNGPAPAESTLLLDLLTPMLPVMLWTASKLKTWPSLLTLSAVLSLDVIASTQSSSLLTNTQRVLSTGLFQISTVPIARHDFPLLKDANFDVSGWNANVNDNVTAMVYYGIWTQRLPLPEWTFDNVTLEPLRPLSDTAKKPVNSLYRGTTKGFISTMECEEAHIDSGGVRITNDYTNMANITFESPSCKAEVALPLIDPTTGIKTWKAAGRNPNRSFVGTSQFVTCPDRSRRFLASVTLVDSNMRLLQSSSLFCRPSYFVQNVNVEVALPGNRPRVDWTTFKAGTVQLEHLDPVDLLSNIVSSARSAGFPTVKQPSNTSVNNDPFLRAASVSLLRDDLDTIYLEPFLDPKVMMEHIRNAFSGMASILVHNRMLSATAQSLLGTSSHDEARVHVPPGTALPIFGLLVLCALFSILLLVLRPRGIVPRDPRSIGGIGIILRNSRDLQRRCGHGLFQLRQSIRDAEFYSYVLPGNRAKFVVAEIAANDREEKRTCPKMAAPNQNQELWQPIVLANWCRILSISVPLLLVAALEYIQRASDRSNGFVAIPNAAAAHYSVNIVPAMVMWATGALFASINFNILLLSPYKSMVGGKASMGQGILSHNLGRLPLVSLLVSIRDKHTSACFSAIGTIMGTFLTIVVAGLYSVTSIDVETQASVRRTDSFGMKWDGSAFEDGGAAQALSLITWQNLTYPQWTYDDLVFPILSMEGVEASSTETGGRVNVSVPARRAVLQCDASEPEKVTVGVLSNLSSSFTIFTELRSRCPGSTGRPIPTRIGSTISNLTGVGGQLGHLWETATIAQGGPFSGKPPPINKPGCHSLIAYYGSFPSEFTHRQAPFNLSSSEARVTTLACTQLVQEVDVTLSLQILAGGSLGVDLNRAPIPDEGTARLVNAGTPDASNVQEYQVAFPISYYFRPVTSDAGVLRRLQTLRGLDGFYQAVVLGGRGRDPDDLVGRENVTRLIEATSKMYGRYMAQVMHRIMRSPNTTGGGSSASQRTFTAAATHSQTRLRQNVGPKVALQVLLGLMSA